MLNFLNAGDVGISLFGDTFHVSLNWIGNLIRMLINGVGVVGVGIILFSVILKLIVMPFDVFQRISMRKQNNKIKENQARLDKLKKQYANDKTTYNQKMAELYKESGISMFSSCLPMILSLVIFIVAINAFNAYSQYSNVNNYNTLVNAYNTTLEYYCADLDEDNLSIATKVEEIKDDEGKVTDSVTTYVFTVKDTDVNEKFIYYTFEYTQEDYDALKQNWTDLQIAENANIKIKSFYIDVAKLEADATHGPLVTTAKATAVEKELESRKQALLKEDESADVSTVTLTDAEKETIEKTAIRQYFEDKAQLQVKHTYKTKVSKKTQFLWIKNIWAVDATYKHPVLSYSSFRSEAKQEKFKTEDGKKSFSSIKAYTTAYDKEAYDLVTEDLGEYKKEANGYYILILLSIGTILLQQVVSMRSQKEQQMYSSVDGQGKSQQKIMMVVMTGMFAIFSFMYSSAFSIYMITSNIFSLLSTLIINKAVDVVAAKKEAAAMQEKYNKRFPGRSYKGEENAKGKKSSDKKNKK